MNPLNREEWFTKKKKALSSVRCWAPFRAATTFAVCQGDDEDVWIYPPPPLPQTPSGKLFFFPFTMSNIILRDSGWQDRRFILFRCQRKEKSHKKAKSEDSDPSGNVCGSDPTFEFTKSQNWKRKINKSWHAVSLALHSNQTFCLCWDVGCFSSHSSGFYQPLFLKPPFICTFWKHLCLSR